MTGCRPRIIGTLLRDSRGSIAVEFALVAPVLMVVLAGVIDIGSAAYARHALHARVTMAADYALLQPAPADQDAASTLAGSLVGLLPRSASDSVEVVVNNAVSAAWNGTAVTTSPGPGNATNCYCPTLSSGDIAWGAVAGCDAPCGSGDSAGKFVRISARSNHVSIFPGYAFIGDTVGASAVLRLN